MVRNDLSDLQAFVAVSDTRSFTRAAARLDVSRSALSHAMSALEARLGVRLLTRTTRSVSLTQAGERLLSVVAPRLEDIRSELKSLSDYRDKPAGLVRLTAHDHAIRTVLWPRLLPLMRAYPDVQVELNVDYALVDIAAQRFDAGVRSGNRIDKDMVAVRIGPDYRMAVAGSPGYFDRMSKPTTPSDLTDHRCINLRLPTHGGLYAWEFEKGRRQVQVRVAGQSVLNNTMLMLQAALDGLGLCYVPSDLVHPYVASGHLVPVLKDWWPKFPGYHLYYPTRRQMTPAFALVVDALRYRTKLG
jgi:DNA-binding transcriptional LysR family regulator